MMPKLRIISGKFGGRLIESTDNATTHPMGDRVRSALFAKIFSRKKIDGARVLDVFAGTGAIGLESLSRGAIFAKFVEKDPRALRILRENIEKLGVEDFAKISKSSAENFAKELDNLPEDERFDLIFLDPPYDFAKNPADFAKLETTMEEIAKKACAKNALMILSYRSGETLPNPKGVVVVDDPKSYGEASLIFYELES
jgi:16S rRNA (guanine(966)-N(2))-methyltransferase RsmD